jgi:adenine-specific DNA-methyltransferase
MNDKIKNLGQVFTQLREIKLMSKLIQNSGTILEPSCGTGNFSNYLNSIDKQCTSIEFDKDICPHFALNVDFFDYNISNKFDTIIGNPPYVAFKEIMDSTRSKLDLTKYDRRTNLHIFFIDKCLKHLKDNGEIIFLTPRDFIKQTSANSLINTLHDMGTMTHFYDYGDQILFKGFSPNCAIWRFEKDNFSHKTELIDGAIVRQQNINGQFIFSNKIYDYDMSSLFNIRVGGVSGLDSVFVHEKGNKEFVYSKTAKTNQTRKIYYNYKDEYIK